MFRQVAGDGTGVHCVVLDQLVVQLRVRDHAGEGCGPQRVPVLGVRVSGHLEQPTVYRPGAGRRCRGNSRCGRGSRRVGGANRRIRGLGDRSVGRLRHCRRLRGRRGAAVGATAGVSAPPQAMPTIRTAAPPISGNVRRNGRPRADGFIVGSNLQSSFIPDTSCCGWAKKGYRPQLAKYNPRM